MSRREYDSAYENQNDMIIKITSSRSYNIIQIKQWVSAGYTKMSFFIVGGGGAGTGDFSGSDTVGFGGCGGECVLVENVALESNPTVGMTIVVGAGGTGGTRAKDGADGGVSSAGYLGVTYTANGGYGGKQVFSKKTLFNTYPRGLRKWGGRGGWWGGNSSTCLTNVSKYYNMTPETAVASATGTEIWYSVKGERGVRNPFDMTDTTLYGCGGGAGYDAYRGSDLSSTYPNYGGDTINDGGGRGGYGSNNASTNKGSDATSYGSGGGGAAFSSSHTNSLGGSGKQGIVIIKLSK